MYRVRAAARINKKKYNQQRNEGETYSTNKYEILCKYRSILIPPSVKRYCGKDGPNCKNGF